MIMLVRCPSKGGKKPVESRCCKKNTPLDVPTQWWGILETQGWGILEKKQPGKSPTTRM